MNDDNIPYKEVAFTVFKSLVKLYLWIERLLLQIQIIKITTF